MQRDHMKATFIVGLVILVLISMGAPFLVIPVHASTLLPTITCWDGSTIGPVNGTYVAHCSPTPVCPHGQSPMPDRTCLPPCGGPGNMTCMWKSTEGNNALGAHGSYQQGYNQGIHDWNMFAQDLSHHFICPYNDTSAYCFGYDAALRFMTSDQ